MNTREKNIILQNWEQFYNSRGVEPELIKVYMSYVEKLVNQSLPPIFDFKHLSLLLNINEYDLASIVNSPSNYYRTFDIPKRNGGFRTITAPYPSLKNIQKWIYHNILSNIKIHGCAHGFTTSRSILTNANVHINQKCLLKIDLKDFFPSIPMSYVLQLFKSLGYAPKVAFYLSSLCCYDECLAQGSPVSPAISNIVAKHLDRRLYRIAKKYKLNYSRYADDIAFSGESINVKFIEYVKDIITDCGFFVNDKKIRLYKEYGNKILTGISLATGVPKLPRDYRRSLEKELFFINKYGIKGHISHNKIRKSNYLESIIGKVRYWLMIEPNNTFAQQMYEKLYAEYKLQLNTSDIEVL